MSRRLGQLIEGLAALAVAVALVVGIPAALVRFVGWPLPTVWPTPGQLRQFAQAGVADETIVKMLAVVVWIAWAQVAAAIAVEAVAVARRRAARPLPVLPGLQPLAARLVAAVALIAATTATARTGAGTMPLQAVVVTPAATVLVDTGVELAPPRADPADAAAAVVATTTVTTTARDSWWRLAEHHLGDGIRWRDLRELNDGRQVAPGIVIDASTEQLHAGWRILVPTDEGPRPTGAEIQTVSASPADEWTVEPGDHFWRIAEATLEQAWGRSPNDAEVAPYWRELVDVNTERLLPPGDPDLIHPGQDFTLPSVPDDPLAQTSTETAPPEPIPSDIPSDAGPTDDRADVGPSDALAPETVPQKRGWEATIDRQDDQAISELDEEAGSDDPRLSDEGDAEARNGVGVPVGLAAGVAATSLLAAGIAALLRWRRRAALRQRPEGYRLPTPLTESQVSRLEAAAVPEQTLDDLAALLASIPSEVHPALVTVSDEGIIRLLFDETTPVPEPPEPWTLADDGTDGPVGWTARLGARGPERSIGLPLLVTLGRTGTTTVLANVAAMTQLAVTGAEPATRRRLRTMALEAATSRVAVPVEVVVAGDDAFVSLDSVRHSHDLASEVDSALAEADHDVVAEDRSVKLLVCCGSAEAPIVPTELRGTVGVVAGEHNRARGWTLHVDDDETGRLHLPDGGSVEIVLPDIDPDAIDDELDRLEEGPTPAMEPASKTGEGQQTDPDLPDPSANGHRPRVALAGPTVPAWCEVRLLGPTEVVRHGTRLDGLTPRSMEVLAYLVTHRNGVSKERLDDAVWSGRAARPGSQRVTSALTKLRDALGDGPDGEPLVPRRTGSERIHLSEHVGSDVDRAFAHLAIARALPAEPRLHEMAAALDLIRGGPFEELPVSWASEVTQRAIAELQDAALEVARSRGESGDLDGAEHAVRQGLRLLDPADALYLQLAEIEKARGRPERVRTIWQQLRQRHADDADEVSGLISAPPAEIELAFRELLVEA